MTVMELMVLLDAAEKEYNRLDAEYVHLKQQIKIIERQIADMPDEQHNQIEALEIDREGMLRRKHDVCTKRNELGRAIDAARMKEI